MTRDTAQILKHPATKLAELQEQRLHYICQAIYFKQRGDDGNMNWCKGKASGLNDAVMALGGEGISMRIEDYEAGDAA